ncbi:ras-related protein Rab-34 [Halyomorpha halys]|uniref:ras-related protein Rab-34 n=1 Tax=Halyomorpha halys TaxID=286706 RepID=UPI0006D4DF15|nr:ras-related protein Rab-34 [Halyomorpha halys]
MSFTVRQINSFRKPFNHLMTPYKVNEINPEVARFCRLDSKYTSLNHGRIIFIGESGVGKSSVIKRFYCNKFNPENRETCGMESATLKFNIFGLSFRLEIWDAAGQERFKWITTSYYRGTNVIVLVFDLSDLSTLYDCNKWLDEASYKNNHDFVFLVGNKLDIVSEQTFLGMKETISQMCEDLNAEFWAVSSKTGKHVSNLFLRMAYLTFEKIVLRKLGSANDESELFSSDSRITLRNTRHKNEQHSNCTC